MTGLDVSVPQPPEIAHRQLVASADQLSGSWASPSDALVSKAAPPGQSSFLTSFIGDKYV